MKLLGYWALVLGANAAVVVARVSNIRTTSNLPQTVSNRFIVEVDELIHIPSQRSLTRSLDIVYSFLQESTLKYEITKEFISTGIFTGVAVTLDNPEDANIIAQIPGVKSIRPSRVYAPPRPVKMHIVAGPNDPELPPDMESTHVMTGVDKLHAEGIIGQGVKIGIIDSGIDYTHPALGAGIGPGHKVIGGYDFVGNAYNGTSKLVPGDDPLDTCNGHGTHVAGIIGANPGNELNISGVAYGASLTSYRIFGCTGSTTDDHALLRGVNDGQDILTLSIGGSDGWTESSSAVVADRVAASGKIVTIAAGNDGASGSWYTSSPGNAINAISVASVDNTFLPLQNATVHGAEHAPITYLSALPLHTEKILPIYATSKDTTVPNDACNPLPDSTPDLSSFVVLIRRGNCTFIQKLKNVAAKGANITLIYNNVPGLGGIDVGNFTATLIQAADGVFLVEQFAAGVPIALSFPQVGAATNFRNPVGGLISEFSSYGPTNDFYFKPAVAAPGGSILSTLPVALGSYGVLSGTSMATPFVAGASALLLATKGKTMDVARSARSIFQSTAQKVSSNITDGDPLQTLTQQGAGLINAYDAIYTTTIISPTELILNDTAHFSGVQNFTVQNNGSQAKIYTLNHVPAGTALTVQSGSIFTAFGPVPLSTVAASVELTPSTFTVEPGQSQLVIAEFTPPAGLDPSTYPVYSGFIEVVSGSENVHACYLGLLGILKDKQVIDNTDEFFGYAIPTILNSTQDPQIHPTNYTFVGADYPSLLWRLVFGTPSLRVDLVEVTTSTTNLNNGLFAQINTFGNLTSFDYNARNNNLTISEGGDPYGMFNLTKPTFGNGTVIPNGSYRVLVRALRVTGNPQSEEDYEPWLSPIFGIQVK